MSAPIIMPTVHMNGTSAEGLKAPLVEAYSKISDAIDAVQAAAPNGRDYYPQGPEAYEAARAGHSKRLRDLDRILAELLAIWTHIEEVSP